ncbi:MAG: GNAT family N-acetyltransferase [Anaerolineae bacterium CG_4_9_14_3_um_filter_57_17]|nr:GNAT family N-acetyltransferase [bacterium]NCT20838.1 GNAT family N-acetyltransferase [bacterium]OIO84447.1 MAG: GNAT family N-acetyltransferase [Anaerolineae bacterium CG2_30_57_67]PJB65210.1 MAG: GNAT family N-acetyltransferase [Anaerolineae bacterium CG_4_9_14_3_um_filter_57_17]
MTLPLFLPRSVTITGHLVRLEPLSLEHVSGLAAISNDPAIWRYMLYGNIDSEAKMRAWVEDMLTRQAAGTDLPFAVRHLPSGKLAGATRYLDLRPAHRGLEIGGTWYGTEFQRSGVNTEAKYLLLRHAFETLGAIRVQFKADSRNEKSLRAIERIGATREGILRNHMILADGLYRHSIYFSVTADEWPAVKAHLEALCHSPLMG